MIHDQKNIKLPQTKFQPLG